MKIAVISQTPLAAAPYELYKAIRKYTKNEVILVNGTTGYHDGRTFPYHLLLSDNLAKQKLRIADLWHIHNYWIPALKLLKQNQKILAQFHSIPRMGNWRELMNEAAASYTIDQPLQVKEYQLPILPNVIDPDEYRPVQKGSKVRIVFAPTTRAAIGHPASKGYHEVKRILASVASRRDVEVEVFEGLSYNVNLERKRFAHILIDDVVTGNWHRTSLEGACFGAAVINACPLPPFVFSTLAGLEINLYKLIDSRGRGLLKEAGERAREWVVNNYHARDTVRRYVLAYLKLLRVN